VTDPQGDWNQYQMLVMDKLEKLEAGQKSMDLKVNKLITNHEVLQVKAGLWGFLSGAVPTGLALLYHLIAGKRSN
tara:strand:+ start:548 stop:772 length:225 start_codon:yes stop_codon:yes gene_type:complete